MKTQAILRGLTKILKFTFKHSKVCDRWQHCVSTIYSGSWQMSVRTSQKMKLFYVKVYSTHGTRKIIFIHSHVSITRNTERN